jgi:hypothetical protein
MMKLNVEVLTNTTAKYQQQWLTEKAHLDAAVAVSSRDKTSLPDNYWQAERHARLRYELAASLLEACRGA